jgi:alpha-amylase
MRIIFTVLFLFLTQQSLAALPRTVMVQLFEWPWKSVAYECETHLGPSGYAAVQVSPPTEHLSLGKNSWWERYQPVNYNIISRSGSESEFKDMISRCQAAGVDVYVDVVLNHMAGIASAVGFAGTHYQKYNHSGLYTYNDFHHCSKNGNNQIVNFNDRWEVQNCELLGLADLKTESPNVKQVQLEYLERLQKMGVKGFRIDAAKHIPAEDLKNLFSLMNKTPYLISETYIGTGEPIKLEEYENFSDINFFQYSFDLGHSVLKGSFSSLLRNMSDYPNSRDAVVFVENHDLQRIDSASIPNYATQQNEHYLANVFMLTWPYGYPQLFSGYHFSNYDEGPPIDPKGFTTQVHDRSGNCQAPWNCEHRFRALPKLIQFRNFTNSQFNAQQIWLGTSHQIAFSRGNLGFVAINGSDHTLSENLATNLPDGIYCNILSERQCSETVKVRNGRIHISLEPKSALVIQKNK